MESAFSAARAANRFQPAKVAALLHPMTGAHDGLLRKAASLSITVFRTLHITLFILIPREYRKASKERL
ncbi:hypothetical protein ASZ97_04275 [Brucella melitensis]|uniref:Uncharacterized protein n=4 Tax=Brucella/Ochrobactrum group TaxID=2826938 RepID=A0AAI8H742_BRUSS|nr:hypothetical protein BMNI_I1849 [Brucella melitensis NI]AHZ82075.1 hypothetical protein DA85_09335 [Brucella canis]AIN85057.1 hypothetical protein IY71_09535 [Brucella suis]AIN91334.1 hypothetical protein DM30_09815 [Brucella abortus]ALF30269.1 hypothetical protein NL70_09225 [Brucella abortus 104M]ALY31399.1 hypothetical protein AWH03_05330 [Brucella suis 019]AOG44460.1 hypothetical protein BFS01_09270 [Brucella sp. 2002734562]AOG50494.1 hypothetical protein BFL33_09145 [Brucella meliten